MKAGLYARVSTDGQTTEQQLIELRQSATQRGWEITEYVDDGFSGALPESKRPALKRLMDDARSGKIKVVLCWDVSRFGRSVQIVVTAVETLRSHGVNFSTLKDNIDTTTPSGEFQFTVFAALAQLQRKMIGVNTKAALKLRRDRGMILGRPSIARRKKKPPVDPAAILRRAAAGDLTIRQLGELFKVGKSTVARILKNLSQKGPSKTAPFLIGGGN